MDILIAAVLLGLIPAAVARRKGYDFRLWWLYGAALFIVALPVAVVMKPNPKTRRSCPLCRSTIDAHARVCRYCGQDVFTALAGPGQHEAAPPSP